MTSASSTASVKPSNEVKANGLNQSGAGAIDSAARPTGFGTGR